MRQKRLDLQAKISLVLLGVIVPTFLIVTVAENKLMLPILADQMKQIGITAGKTLATEIVTQKLLGRSDSGAAIESRVQELLYLQPYIRRIDVYSVEPGLAGKDQDQTLKRIASSVEEEPGESQAAPPIVKSIVAEYHAAEAGDSDWEISVPIEHKSRDLRTPKRLLGMVHVVASMSLVNQIVGILWTTTATAAAFSVVLLIFALSYFLRKTIANDRRLKQAESQNLQLTEQLHETERQLMNTEKLAVMGQLTASFAHEIGTPLNAIGGHLQLLKEETSASSASTERFTIVEGQLGKIEQIVKTFLQSTSKPSSQRQLVDPNAVVDQTLRIVRPRTEAMAIDVRRDYDRAMGPIRIVPVELEQILLNLVNNSLDSLHAKSEARETSKKVLQIRSKVRQEKGQAWAVISVFDTGQGISKFDIPKVFKPFYTTKRPGEGTGLGLTICSDLARRYGGMLQVDSKEGSWTQVTIKIPYAHFSEHASPGPI